MVDSIDFICYTNMPIPLQNMPIIYLVYMAYVSNLVGRFVFGTYLEITGEVSVAVSCVLTHV